ncbi:MAG: helix-turn-helix transcriptional regulator [Chloroflexaceae bacterium]|nr:helix-turn-helix transcriptional regulator [Chloroflexaceae bacterium]
MQQRQIDEWPDVYETQTPEAEIASYCPIEATLRVVGGKWKPLIIYYLLGGTRRFGALRRLIPKVTQQMLTMQLRELAQDGIVHRKVYAEVPPRVEYSITEYGRTLEPFMNMMAEWGAAHQHATARHEEAS